MASSLPSQTTRNKRASFFSHLIGPSGLPSSPSPKSPQTSEYHSTSPRPPAAGWQEPPPVSLQPQSPLGPLSPSCSMKTQSSTRTTSSTLSQKSRVNYVPMTYEPGSYAPISSMPELQGGVEKERKGKGSASRLGSMFSRFTGGKRKEKKGMREEEVVKVKAHNDLMDEDY